MVYTHFTPFYLICQGVLSKSQKGRTYSPPKAGQLLYRIASTASVHTLCDFRHFVATPKSQARGQGATSEMTFGGKRRCLQENSKHSNRVPKLQKGYSRSSARQPSVPLHFVKATKIFCKQKFFSTPAGQP